MGVKSGRDVKYVTFVGAKSGEARDVKQQAQLEGWRLDGFTHPPLLLLPQPPNTSIGVHPINQRFCADFNSNTSPNKPEPVRFCATGCRVSDHDFFPDKADSTRKKD